MLKGAGLVAAGVAIGVAGTVLWRTVATEPQMDGELQVASFPSDSFPPVTTSTVSRSSSEELIRENERLRALVGQLEVTVQMYQDHLTTLLNPQVFRDQSEPTGGVSVAQLMDGGFSRERAEELRERFSELHSQRVHATLQLEAYAISPEGVIRSEIGDAEFEEYTIAIGRVPAVQVGKFAETSPASYSGLRTDDQIISYDGHRVFDAREVASLMFQSASKHPVILEVMRGGQLIQLAIPGGLLEVELISNGLYVPTSFVPAGSIGQ